MLSSQSCTRQVSILFEVEHLVHASPATISRAGMIYFGMDDLGWRPVAASWLANKADPALSGLLSKLIDA